MDILPFESALVGALRQVVQAFRAEHPGDAIAGLALLTDDGLSSVSAALVGAAQVIDAGSGDLLFTPWNWSDDSEPEAFDALSQMLFEASERSADFDRFVDETFAVLVSALKSLRQPGGVDAGAFLTVLSTDPSDHLRALQATSVDTLNNADVARAWHEFRARRAARPLILPTST